MNNKQLFISIFFLFFLQSSVSFFELSEIYGGGYNKSIFTSASVVGTTTDTTKNALVNKEQEAYIQEIVSAYLKHSSDPITSLYHERITREAVRDFFIKTTGSEKITKTILYYAEKENLPIGVVFSLVFVESKFRTSTINTANKNKTSDLGLFQLNSKTFRHFSKKDFFNLDTNVKAGVGYLRYAFNLDPNPKIALAIYNAGPTRPLRGLTPETTKIYVSRILTYANRLESQFSYYMKKRFASSKKVVAERFET